MYIYCMYVCILCFYIHIHMYIYIYVYVHIADTYYIYMYICIHRESCSGECGVRMPARAEK